MWRPMPIERENPQAKDAARYASVVCAQHTMVVLRTIRVGGPNYRPRDDTTYCHVHLQTKDKGLAANASKCGTPQAYGTMGAAIGSCAQHSSGRRGTMGNQLQGYQW
jgi:hypothetical protein